MSKAKPGNPQIDIQFNQALDIIEQAKTGKTAKGNSVLDNLDKSTIERAQKIFHSLLPLLLKQNNIRIRQGTLPR